MLQCLGYAELREERRLGNIRPPRPDNLGSVGRSRPRGEYFIPTFPATSFRALPQFLGSIEDLFFYARLRPHSAPELCQFVWFRPSPFAPGSDY